MATKKKHGRIIWEEAGCELWRTVGRKGIRFSLNRTDRTYRISNLRMSHYTIEASFLKERTSN